LLLCSASNKAQSGGMTPNWPNEVYNFKFCHPKFFFLPFQW
jgi:hypothetical protein